MNTRHNQKIFGLGLPKSGTTTLHRALEILGYSSIHNPGDSATARQLRNGDYNLSILEHYDAVMDNPIPAVFAQLDECWPGSKFILTIRPIEEWLKSSKNAGFNQKYATPKVGSTVEFHNTLLFGCNGFCESRYKWVYESHHSLVLDYFTGAKADQLLILDLGKKASWHELCEFLGVQVPDQPFPHANSLKTRMPLSSFEQTLVAGLVKLGVDYRLLREIGNKIRSMRKDR